MMEAMDKFKDYLIQEEKSELTIEKYVRDVRRFLNWIKELYTMESDALHKRQIERMQLLMCTT